MAKKKFNITKEQLEDLYFAKQFSMKEVALELKCSAQTVCNALRFYGLSARSSAQHSEKTKAKMSELKKGPKCHWFGKKRPEHSKAMTGKFLGRKYTEETRRKMSLIKNGMWAGKYKGSECPHWVEPNKRKGTLNKNIRRLNEMKQWREAVFQRDNWTCQMCEIRGSVELNADHIYPLYKLIEDLQIQTLEQAIVCEPIWNIENGRTLCVSCHRKCETHGRPKIK